MTVQEEKHPAAEDSRKRGEVLAGKLKELVREGNARRIVVKDTRDRVVLDIPVNAGVAAAVLAPAVTAVGALSALVGPWSIDVTRRDDVPADEEPS